MQQMYAHREFLILFDSSKKLFQKKRTYISTPWGGQEQDKADIINHAINDAYPKINLTDAKLVTAFANNPNLLNVKNDFSVWGTYKSLSGADIPIHMRYALDTKPTSYTSLDNIEYTIDKWDWREIIYQMAVDYYKNSNWTTDDFCLRVAAANPNLYPSGKTGYEQYYTDIQGFWRILYDPEPEASYEEIGASEVATNGDGYQDVYVQDYYRIAQQAELVKDDENGKREYVYDIDKLYVIQENNIKKQNGENNIKTVFYPFIGSQYCHLDMKDDDSGESQEYYYYDGTEYKPTTSVDLLNLKRIQDLYVDIGNGKKQLLIEVKLNEVLNNNIVLWIKEEEQKKRIIDLEEECRIIYRNGIEDNSEYVQYLTRWALMDNYGNLATPDNTSDNVPQETSDRVTYLRQYPNGDYDPITCWNYLVKEDPGQLIFWFDFLETEGSDLYKYSVKEIGSRTKSINDSNVKSIYYRDVPNVIFVQSLADNEYERKSGYTYIQLPLGYISLFSISGRGKSAKERIDELLQEHSYVTEQTNITTVPLYHLEPNTRISVQDDMSNVDGEYIITKVNIPLAYNGTMNLQTTKVVTNII